MGAGQGRRRRAAAAYTAATMTYTPARRGDLFYGVGTRGRGQSLRVDEDDVVVNAYRGRALIGSAWARELDGDDALLLQGVYVAEGFRRHGVARELIARIAEMSNAPLRAHDSVTAEGQEFWKRISNADAIWEPELAS